MESRKYSVQEIDELRKVLKTRFLFGTSNPSPMMWSQCYKENEVLIAVEERLRTHMLAGHVASDIYEADKNEIQQKAKNE